jgi:predicted Zn-dependent protease
VKDVKGYIFIVNLLQKYDNQITFTFNYDYGYLIEGEKKYYAIKLY